MRDLPLPTLPFSDLRPAHAPQARTSGETPRLQAIWARTEDDVRAAQALRYQVFVEEMGAKLPAGTPEGRDVDRFDAYCEHLLVRTEDHQVIGTYRVLTPAAAVRAGGLYSETEFDLSPVQELRSRMVELGRSCIHSDHRNGGVIMALWGALGSFMQRNGLDTMIGCASVSMADGGHYAASLWKRLAPAHMAAPQWQVQPLLALPVDELRQDLPAEPPPLIKGYLRCGARLLGAPAWDPDFNAADLPMMMRLAELPERYRRHFLA